MINGDNRDANHQKFPYRLIYKCADLEVNNIWLLFTGYKYFFKLAVFRHFRDWQVSFFFRVLVSFEPYIRYLLFLNTLMLKIVISKDYSAFRCSSGNFDDATSQIPGECAVKDIFCMDNHMIYPEFLETLLICGITRAMNTGKSSRDVFSSAKRIFYVGIMECCLMGTVEKRKDFQNVESTLE